MDAFDYTRKMREFAAALDPLYRFFEAEKKTATRPSYRRMCKAIMQGAADIEYRLDELAARYKFGTDAAAQAKKEVDEVEEEEERDAVPLTLQDVM